MRLDNILRGRNTDRVSSDAGTWGPNLYAYLEAHWSALGISPNAWAGQHPGIEGPTLSRWKQGAVPKLQAMVTVADALGVTLLDVLIGAGIVDKSDAKRDAYRPAMPNIDDAIERDPDLSREARDGLRAMLAAIRGVQSGATSRVRGRTTRR